MPKRLTVVELANRIDGLALAFFASMGAVCSALVEVHPDEEGVIEGMRDEALALLVTLDDIEQEVFTPDAIEQAVRGVVSAFVTRGETEASNDNGEG